MTQYQGYRFEVLRPSAEFTLYRGHAPDKPSLLGLAPSGNPSARNADCLSHEYDLAKELDPAWAARPLAFARHDGRLMLLFADFGGDPLDCVIEKAQRQPFELTRLLRVAGNMAWALGRVHKQRLVHKDIKPANVLVDEEGRVRLFGFGIASRLLRERQEATPPELIAGTPAYMAPEQTGRMNRSVDARSDLYALGVTLYELFTGALPFTASDPMEWIHCHVARQPSAPSVRAPGLPPMIDEIVLRLLAKNPEDRYQTATGLETDLRQCLAQWEAQGAIDAFALARHDVADRLVLPEKLYGRDAEIGILLAAFERVVKNGPAEMVLVRGYAGIGKSSIVNELHKVLITPRGLFATGKFDQYKRDIPHATLAQAFQGLVRPLLSKSNEELARWREKLLAALGPNGQLMVNLIPELALVIGEQPPIPRVEPQDAAARFHLVFKNLLDVFARPEHPLVLFIDDLQWLDIGTLDLLQRLITEPGVRHFLLIGAYRDNEVGPGHPLTGTLAAIETAGRPVSQLTLAPLQVDHIAKLLAVALHSDVERIAPLAELVAEKSGGNPFFVTQFMTELADEGLLGFDQESASWRWPIDKIRSKGITDNVADLMAKKLGRLPAVTRELLGQLACVGNVVDTNAFALLRGAPEDQINATLRDAVEAGLLLSDGRSFAFTHDRVHEGAYALISGNDLAATHLRIGRTMLRLTSPEEREDKVFDIVNHFSRGESAIGSIAERDVVAGLNLVAGKRAKTSSAHASAQAYFSAGLSLLGESSWDRQYRLTFELELHFAECEIVIGQLVAVEGRLTALSMHARGLADQASVVCLAVLLYFTTGRNALAVDAALLFLSRVGIVWSPRPAEVEVRQEYEQMRRNLAVRPMETLVDLPVMSDPACLATMAVLTELFPAAYAFDRYLLELVLLRMTNLSLEHGHCEGSSVAYSALNMALGEHFGDYATAFSLGKLACELVDRRGMDRYKARVYCCFVAFSMPWIQHVSFGLPLLSQSVRGGSSMGDTAFAAYTWRVMLTHLLASGMPLPQVQQEVERAFAFTSRIELGMTTERFVRQLDFVHMLRGVPAEYRACDEEWATQEVEQHPSLAMMVCYYWIFRLQERFLAMDFAAAADAAAHVEKRRWALRSTLEEAEYDFYAALTYAALCTATVGPQRDGHLQSLSMHFELIVMSAENCPENFANRKALVGAELARLEGRDGEAQDLYEEAVRLARSQGFLQNEGIADELAGQYYARRGLGTVADAYLRNARDCFARWGAVSKVNQLDDRYPQLHTRALPRSPTATIDKPVAQLDVEAVDKASQTLSSEMALPTLLEKLMRLAVEHAGAERGLLILLQGDEPYIEAEAMTGHGSVEVLLQRVRASPMDLPQSALHYVLRTHERLVLDDATAAGLDPGDPYVSRKPPKSVLCLPIFKQTQVIGALYLENNLTTCAFTAGRVAVLDFLASQAAIWLENARLYSDLRRSETWLREAQYLSATGSFYWRVSSENVEFSEQTFRTYELDPALAVTIDLITARIYPEDLPILHEMLAIARGPATDLDYLYRAQMPDRSIKHLHLVAHASRDENGEIEYVGAIQDVTQRYLAEEALGKARSELAHVTRITTLGALTASIAHEVNQPLLGIVTNASTCLRMLAADPPNITGARLTAQRSIRDGHRAADVIKRLRALFGKKGTATELVDLNEATREVISLSSSELQRNRLILQIDLANGLPLVMGDRVQLQQVVLNLLLNASDAMHDVHDRPRQLLIRTGLDGCDEVSLTVQDVGIGFDAQGADRLFEAFYTTKSGGMGMGLSVSRSIIESHHGRLWATMNEGPGATFAFTVPCGPVAISSEDAA